MTEFEIGGDRSAGPVGAILSDPAGARAVYVMACGAGAGMRHAFLEEAAAALAAEGVATLRFDFPYRAAGRARPDPPAVLEAYVRAACAAARARRPGLPLFAGGKSMGGRMTSGAQAREPIEGVRGLVFLGFPLHAPGRPGRERAAHLADVRVPMLFLQGTRDSLADLALVRETCADLGDRATLHVVEGGDHSFAVPKRSGRSRAETIAELAAVTAGWIDDHA